MMTLTQSRISDVHQLNREFLALCNDPIAAEALGVEPAFCESLAKSDPMALERAACTDVLLFKINDAVADVPMGSLPEKVSSFLQKLSITVRDVASQDPVLAVSHYGIKIEKCNDLIKMPVMAALNYFQHGKQRFSAINTTKFCILTGLDVQAERTQFLTLAANDDHH
ncbi:hypothetical protein [Azonexus hydrophilus]|uniref:YbaK/aminoacyl-tRNA synthetase-associated domain-containing protein n=1 Tax=Azonexus hydrophilus TaxID=418702 RepID=A0ABZ2XLM6_9RHOO